jgi:AcrR family transcriptional regulator
MAMIEAVAAKGYAATTVGDVVARSGVSRATFYELFDNKDDCFRATYARAAEQFATSLAAMVASDDPSGGMPLSAQCRVDRLLTAYLDVLAAQPAFAKAFLVEVYAAGPDVVGQRRASLETFVDVVEALLGDARPATKRADRRTVSRILVHAISSMVTQLVGVGEADRLTELKAPLMALVADLLPDPPDSSRLSAAGHKPRPNRR